MYNIDQQEVAKFNVLASRWWDQNSELKTLHDINPLRLGYIEKYAGHLTGKTVLDVGCGGGILSEGLAQCGAIVTGIDISEEPLNVAKLHLYESSLEVDYQHITPEQLAENQPHHFDVVVCMEMLEHVPDPASVITACAKLVKPEGHVFFSTINRNPKSYLFAVIGAEYLLKLLPRGTHDYSRFIQPIELDAWLRQANLTLKHISGMNYNPLNQHYWLSHDVAVNYLVYAQCCF